MLNLLNLYLMMFIFSHYFSSFLDFSFNIFLEFVVAVVFVVFVLTVCLSDVGSWDCFLTFLWDSVEKRDLLQLLVGQFTDSTILGQVKRKSKSKEMIVPEFCEFAKFAHTWPEPCLCFASTPATSSSTGLVVLVPESSCGWESRQAQVALWKWPTGESAVKMSITTRIVMPPRAWYQECLDLFNVNVKYCLVIFIKLNVVYFCWLSFYLLQQCLLKAFTLPAFR